MKKRGGKRAGSGRQKRFDEPTDRLMVNLPESVQAKLGRMCGRKMKRKTPRGEDMLIESFSDAIVDIMDRRK